MLFGNTILGSKAKTPNSNPSSSASRYAAMVAASRANKARHAAVNQPSTANKASNSAATRGSRANKAIHSSAYNRARQGAAASRPTSAPAPAPAPLPPATGSSYQGGLGTYEQKVMNVAGQHAGTLHFKDGRMYQKSWVDDGEWKHGNDLDHKYGADKNYVGLPGHHYGNIKLTSSPESTKTGPDFEKLLADMLGDNQASIDKVLASSAAANQGFMESMAANQAANQESLQEMINVMNAANAVEEAEPKVLGVKSAGDPNAMTIRKQKQGVKGTFGREGLRIKGLNI